MTRQPYEVEGNLLRTDFRKGAPTPSLNEGGGGGTYDGMDARVTRLETHMEYVQRDLAELKSGQTKILDKLDGLRDLPTRRDLDAWRWQWMAIGLTIIALTVGGITGGLTLIERGGQNQQVRPAVPASTPSPKPPAQPESAKK